MSELGDILADALGDLEVIGMTDVTIRRATATTRDPANPAGGTRPTFATYAGRGFIEKTGTFHDGTLVKEGHVLISVLGGTITNGAGVEQFDTITINGATYKVERVMVDPVEGTFEAEAKK